MKDRQTCGILTAQCQICLGCCPNSCSKFVLFYGFFHVLQNNQEFNNCNHYLRLSEILPRLLDDITRKLFFEFTVPIFRFVKILFAEGHVLVPANFVRFPYEPIFLLVLIPLAEGHALVSVNFVRFPSGPIFLLVKILFAEEHGLVLVNSVRFPSDFVAVLCNCISWPAEFRRLRSTFGLWIETLLRFLTDVVPWLAVFLHLLPESEILLLVAETASASSVFAPPTASIFCRLLA